MIPSEKIITEWLLDTKGHAEDLDKLAVKYKRQAAHEKNLDLVRGRLDGTTDKYNRKMKQLATATTKATRATEKLGRASGSLSKTFGVMQVAAGNLVAKGVTLLASKLIESAKASEKYTQAAAVYKGSIEGARSATQGLVSDLDLMIAKNRLTTLGVKLTDERFNSMLGHVRRLSQVMSIDMATALEKTTFGLSRQSQKLIDDIGVVLNATKAQKSFADRLGITTAQLTEQQKAAAFATEALIQMESKAVDLGKEVSTATQDFTRLKISISNATTAGISAITKWKPLIGLMSTLAGATKQWASELEGLTGKGTAAGKRTQDAERLAQIARDITLREKRLTEVTVPRMQKALSGEIEALQIERANLWKNTRAMSSYEKGLQKIVKAEKEAASQKAALARAGMPFEPIELTLTPPGKAKKKKATRKAAGFQFDPTTAEVGAPPIDFEAALKMRETLEIAPQLSAAMGGVADGILKINEANLKTIATTEALAATMRGSLGASFADVTSGTLAMLTEGIANMASGMWDAVGAALAAGQSIEAAILKMVSQGLLALAKQATIYAVAEIAMALGAQGITWGFPNSSSTNHWASAGMWLAVAGASGAAGLGVASAAGGAKSGESAAATKAGATSGPSYGKQVQNAPPVTVNVYFDSMGNPSYALLATKQIQTQVSGG